MYRTVQDIEVAVLPFCRYHFAIASVLLPICLFVVQVGSMVRVAYSCTGVMLGKRIRASVVLV